MNDFMERMYRRMQYLVYMAEAMENHIRTWGVPYGPTLTMVTFISPRSIRFSDQQKDPLEEQYLVKTPFQDESLFEYGHVLHSLKFPGLSDSFYKYISFSPENNLDDVKETWSKTNPKLVNKEKTPYDPYFRIWVEKNFDLHEWEKKLLEVIMEVVNTNEAEVAIEALPIYDRLRRRMDIMQAVPPARRKI